MVVTNALKASLCVLFVLLLPAAALAIDPVFSVQVTSVKSTILLNEMAEFTVSVENLDTQTRTYIISSPEIIGWDIHTDPRSAYLVSLAPGETKDVDVLVRPVSGQSGHFNLQLTITERASGATNTKMLTVDIVPRYGQGKQYEPALTLDIIADDELDPREQGVVKVRVRNMVPRELADVAITIRSALFEDTALVTLKAHEERTQVFLIPFDPLQDPMDDLISAEAVLGENNKTYRWTADKHPYSIAAYASLDKQESEIAGFLRAERTYTFSNDGNVPKQVNFQYVMPLMKDWFSSLSERSSVERIDGERYRVVSFELGPQQSREIRVMSNYRSLFWMALFAIIVLILYYQLRSPVIIRKGAISLDRKHDGMSEIKISLYVKNRTGTDFEKIQVQDRIPHLTQIDKEFHVGTIKPENIVRLDKKHSMVRYVINHLEPFEERIITYKIKSRLTMIGGLTLPSGVVKFRTRNKRVRSSYSNRVILS